MFTWWVFLAEFAVFRCKIVLVLFDAPAQGCIQRKRKQEQSDRRKLSLNEGRLSCEVVGLCAHKRKYLGR